MQPKKEKSQVRVVIEGLLGIGILVGYAYWSSRPPEVISATDTWQNIGQKRTVSFYVANTAQENFGQEEFLDEKVNYKHGFSVYIPGNIVSEFGFNDPATIFKNKTIKVTGNIVQYNGAPQIVLTNSSQITSQ